MIIGLTDKPLLRRDGKIRAGFKDEKGNPKNSPHFLLHDAPQLIPILGETPTSIMFTLHSDVPEESMQDDLRYYKKHELVCKSMHGAKDLDGNDMGAVAAYMAFGNDPGVSQVPFPHVQGARVRKCQYKSCPDYIKSMCGEHMFLNVMIPHYSMGAVFTLDSASILALMNTVSALQKAQIRYGGKLSGQIFRMFKKEVPVPYEYNGKKGTRPAPVVHVESVDFETYIREYGEKISAEDMLSLQALRGRPYTRVVGFSLPSPEVAQLEAPATQTMLSAPQPTEEDILRERANHEAAAPLFEQLCQLTGKTNSEEIRVATAKAFADVNSMVAVLQKKLKEAKKPAPPVFEAPAELLPQAGDGKLPSSQSADSALY